MNNINSFCGVAGTNVVFYRLEQVQHVESIERMVARVKETMADKIEIGYDGKIEFIDTEKIDLMAYDSELDDYTKINRIMSVESDEWKYIKIKGGRILEATDLNVIRSYDDIAKTEGKVARVNYYSNLTEENHMDRDYTWILGALLGDGCYSRYEISIAINSKGEDEIEEKCTECFPKFFGLKCVPKKMKNANCKLLYARGRGKLAVFREIVSLFGERLKKNRHIPNEIFRCDYQGRMGFLGGLIDADGTVVRGNYTINQVRIGSTNKELALQQMYLAQTLGMPARIYLEMPKRRAHRFRVVFDAKFELAEYIYLHKKSDRLSESASSHMHKSNELKPINGIIGLKQKELAFSFVTESGGMEISGVYCNAK